MKNFSLSSVLSVVGVLAAAGAAYATNSTVMNTASPTETRPEAVSTASASMSPAPLSTSPTSLDSPAVSIAALPDQLQTVTPATPGFELPATRTPAPASPTAATSSGSSAPVAAYDLGRLGRVSLRATEGFVEVVSLNSTWSVERIHGNNRLVLVFSKGGERFAFDVRAAGTSMTTNLVDQTPPPPTTTSPRDHESDDDHYEHEEHDDEHEEEDD